MNKYKVFKDDIGWQLDRNGSLKDYPLFSIAAKRAIYEVKNNLPASLEIRDENNEVIIKESYTVKNINLLDDFEIPKITSDDVSEDKNIEKKSFKEVSKEMMKLSLFNLEAAGAKFVDYLYKKYTGIKSKDYIFFTKAFMLTMTLSMAIVAVLAIDRERGDSVFSYSNNDMVDATFDDDIYYATEQTNFPDATYWFSSTLSWTSVDLGIGENYDFYSPTQSIDSTNYFLYSTSTNLSSQPIDPATVTSTVVNPSITDMQIINGKEVYFGLAEYKETIFYDDGSEQLIGISDIVSSVMIDDPTTGTPVTAASNMLTQNQLETFMLNTYTYTASPETLDDGTATGSYVFSPNSVLSPDVYKAYISSEPIIAHFDGWSESYIQLTILFSFAFFVESIYILTRKGNGISPISTSITMSTGAVAIGLSGTTFAIIFGSIALVAFAPLFLNEYLLRKNTVSETINSSSEVSKDVKDSNKDVDTKADSNKKEATKKDAAKKTDSKKLDNKKASTTKTEAKKTNVKKEASASKKTSTTSKKTNASKDTSKTKKTSNKKVETK
ncbi:MAG: hypothetical protein HRS57_00560 [Mycoplasmataceae bacterium]|nr:hypothetical protein [Mycoplasmataceae bacterium]